MIGGLEARLTVSVARLYLPGSASEDLSDHPEWESPGEGEEKDD